MLDQLKEHRPIVTSLPMNEIEARRFGGKAAGLAKAATEGFSIPRTIVGNHELVRAVHEASLLKKQILSELAQEMKFLQTTSKLVDKVVVRSSHMLEGSAGASTSGAFKSYAVTADVECVFSAINRIAAHADSVSFDSCGDDKTSALSGLSVLIQEEVVGDYFGILSLTDAGIEIEYTRDEFSDVVSGALAASRLFLMWDGTVLSSGRERNAAIERAIPRQQLKRLKGCSLEFAISGNKFFVLQVNEFNKPSPGYKLNSKDGHLFSKSIAMRKFSDMGLFTNPLLILKGSGNIETTLSEIENFWNFDEEITLRISNGGNIGMPRGFFGSMKEVRYFIEKNGSNDCEIIVHPFMNVTHSFEINIEEHGFFMEHVPGIWEADSLSPPDFIICRHSGSCEASVVISKRKCKVAFSGGDVVETPPPLSPTTVEEFGEFASEVSAAVRSIPEITLPVNVHAIWDEIRADFQCLNLRPSMELPVGVSQVDKLHVIESSSDVHLWNEKDPVLFRMTTARGHESEVIEVARILARYNADVFVEFGLLSHPSMVLRDNGCHVMPVFDSKFDGSNRENWSFKIDIGNDAVDRIMSEEALIENDTFHIVQDAQPLTRSHILAVSKSDTLSVVDGQIVQEALKFCEEFSGDNSFFYERGRASFCTSGFTNPHAHFHLVTGLDNDKTFGKMTKRLNVNMYSSLEDAYRAIGSFGEYCVFGSSKLGFAVYSGTAVGKRFFRSCAQSYTE